MLQSGGTRTFEIKEPKGYAPAVEEGFSCFVVYVKEVSSGRSEHYRSFAFWDVLAIN